MTTNRFSTSGAALMAALVALAAMPPTVCAEGEIIDDSANALMLATQAKGLIRHASNSNEFESQSDRMRSGRGSNVVTHPREAGCGGVAIGNIRPVPGDHRQHESTVIIRGSVINTGNDC